MKGRTSPGRGTPMVCVAQRSAILFAEMTASTACALRRTSALHTMFSGLNGHGSFFASGKAPEFCRFRAISRRFLPLRFSSSTPLEVARCSAAQSRMPLFCSGTADARAHSRGAAVAPQGPAGDDTASPASYIKIICGVSPAL